MSLPRQFDRNGRIHQSGSRGSLQNNGRPQDSLNLVRTFNFSVFYREIKASLDLKDQIITITHDQSYPYRVAQIASQTFHTVFYIVANSLRRKSLENKIQAVVMTIKQTAQFLSQIPNNSCIIIDSLWDINKDITGPQLEQIILILSKRCQFIYNSMPFANLQTISQWIFSFCGLAPKIIEAPIERNAVAHFIFSENPFQNRLFRNTSIFIDMLTVSEILDRCTPNMISNDGIFQEICDIKKLNLDPILVVFPSNGHLRSFAKEHPEYQTIYDSYDLNQMTEQIEKFQSTSNGILLTTTKVADSIYIPAKSVVLTSLLKFDGHMMKTMTPCEVHQIVRCAGRPGIDPRGYFYTTLHPGMSKFDISSIFSTDLPVISSRFKITEEFFLTAIFSGVADFENYLCCLLGSFTVATRGPLLQDQINQISSQMPPDSIVEKVIHLMSLETSICTLETHPLNIKPLLVNGRVVRARSMLGDHAWSICFGGTVCGTVTLAMRGVPSRGRTIDNDEKCLITLPVHEIVAISKTINPLSRQQLTQIDDNDALIGKDYEYYDGELTYANEKYHMLLNEMQQIKSTLEPNLLQCWRQLAEVCIRHKLLKQKMKQINLQQPLSDLSKIRDSDYHIGLFPGASDMAAQKAFVVRSSGVFSCYALENAIENKFWEKLSDKESAAFIILCIGGEKYDEYTGYIPECVNSYMTQSGKDSSFFLNALALLDEENETNLLDTKAFEMACLLKKARKSANALFKAANQLNIPRFSQKMSNVVEIIKNSSLYREFF